MRTVRQNLTAVAVVCVTMFLSSCFNRDHATNKLYFEPPERLIEDYTGMVEVQELNWAWSRPGFKLSNYRSFTIQPVINLTEVEDNAVAKRVDNALADWFVQNGFIVSENGLVSCEGAIVALKLERTFFEKKFIVREKEADLFLEMEFIFKEIPSQTTLCKIRHGVLAPQRDQLADLLVSGLLSYLDTHT